MPALPVVVGSVLEWRRVCDARRWEMRGGLVLLVVAIGPHHFRY